MKYKNPDCPFCVNPGSNCSVDEVAFGDKKPFAVVCENCGAIGPRAATPEKAVEKWDTRNIRRAPSPK